MLRLPWVHHYYSYGKCSPFSEWQEGYCPPPTSSQPRSDQESPLSGSAGPSAGQNENQANAKGPQPPKGNSKQQTAVRSPRRETGSSLSPEIHTFEEGDKGTRRGKRGRGRNLGKAVQVGQSLADSNKEASRPGEKNVGLVNSAVQVGPSLQCDELSGQRMAPLPSTSRREAFASQLEKETGRSSQGEGKRMSLDSQPSSSQNSSVSNKTVIEGLIKVMIMVEIVIFLIITINLWIHGYHHHRTAQ